MTGGTEIRRTRFTSSSRYIALVLGLFSSGVFVPAHATTRVEIVIDEPHEDRDVAWPLTTGIPFPRGGLTNEGHCRLVDDRGNEQPLQSKVAATWDAEGSSIRWLIIDFIALPNRSYTLEFGSGVQRSIFDSSLNVDKGPELYRVATGAVVAEFSRSGPSAFQSLQIDVDGNGQIESGEVAVTGGASGDHYYLAQNGERFSSARENGERQIVVETAGPVRACVRVDGFYTGPQGTRIVKYRTRYHFFAGLGLVKVVDEFRIIGSTKGTRFRDIGFSLALPGDATNRRIRVDGSGEPGNQVVSIPWQASTRSVSSYQATYRHFGNQACRGAVVESTPRGERTLCESDHVGEWMQVVNGRAAVTGSLRWFWQQFPKEWETEDDELVLHLWSPRGGDLDFGAGGLRKFFGEAGHKYILEWDGVRGTLGPISNFFYFAGHAALERGDVDGQGINKHHEFYLHVGAADQADAGQRYGRLAARPPLALATGEWNCATGVFGPLASRPNNSKYEAIVDRIFDLGRDVQDSFGDYGWWVFGSGPHYSYQWDAENQRHYADPRRFEYHTYQKETQLWWNYLRSGERKFIDWALPSENHWVDIAVTHVPLEYQCDWRGGFRQQQTLQFRPGDWSIDSAMHYVRQRDSAEAWLRGGSQFWASYHRTLETTTLAYYLTGDERFNDVLNYWRDYWSDLAGKTSASPDIPACYREQPWFVPSEPGQPAKTWAEMIRDYAPFTSGLRHQMTQLFNLATLYEHTWDPEIGQALRECADAYLDPQHRIGVWRTQENRLPGNADAPWLGHYWVPALWKYERASGDPRMKEILRGYFDACYAADPFAEDVGQYSNVHLGYAWYYTHDPRHLPSARLELDLLLPNAAPLARPEDLGRRLYNPYVPIRALTAVPRLVWALEDAKRNGVDVPPLPPLKPQRTAIAIRKQRDKPMRLTLWGYDRQLKIIAPDGTPLRDFEVATRTYSSHIQPFDRNLRNFEVYLHELTIPAEVADGYYVFAPELELAVLRVPEEVRNSVLVSAAQPIALEAGEQCRIALGQTQVLQVASASPASLQFLDEAGNTIPAPVADGRMALTVSEQLAGRSVTLRNGGRGKVWFQFVNCPPAQSWISFSLTAPQSLPSQQQTQAALPTTMTGADTDFVAGRFGKAIRIMPGRELHLPDHVTVAGETLRLFDLNQGTIEFWIKKQWDDRVVSTRPVTFLTNGLIEAWSPWKIPLDEWTHVAVEWRPLKRDPSRQAVHIYVNGHDPQNYRSTWWEGYSQKPRTFRNTQEWFEEFLCKTQPGAPFTLDELRISDIPRYADLNVQLGAQQTFNPSRFDPPAGPFEMDDHTLLLFRFDGDLSGRSSRTKDPIQGKSSDSTDSQ